MGQVYKARDTRLDRIVAIKVSKEDFSDRFERESPHRRRLESPQYLSALRRRPELPGDGIYRRLANQAGRFHAQTS
jgi:serine/threonine protein kinase